MAVWSAGLHHHLSLEPVLLGPASGESSPALHARDGLQLSLPRGAQQTQQERRLRLRATSISSPHWQDTKPSLLVSLHEPQGGTSPCNPNAYLCCSTAERQQQVLQSMMPHEVERRCAEDLVAAAASAIPSGAFSLFSHAVSLTGSATCGLRVPVSRDSGTNKDVITASAGVGSSSPPPAGRQHKQGRISEEEMAQAAILLQDPPLSAYPEYHHGTQAAHEPNQVLRQQLPQLALGQLPLHQWRVMGPYGYGVPGSGGTPPVHYQVQPPHRILQYQQPLELQQRLLSNRQLHQRLQQQLGQRELNYFAPTVALQRAAAQQQEHGPRMPRHPSGVFAPARGFNTSRSD